MPHLTAVNTSNKEDVMNDLKLRMDISVYNHIKGVPPPNRTNFSQMELWMEFKTSGVAFKDPLDNSEESRQSAIKQGSFILDTVNRVNTCGQLAHYAGTQHSKQFWHFSFSILVEGDTACFLWWDPAGTVVMAAFNYCMSPTLMAKFLWQFDHLSARECGHDESIQPVNLSSEIDMWVWVQLGIKDKNTPLYRYMLPSLKGRGFAYGPRLPSQMWSLISRCTCNLPVFWIPNIDIDEGSKLYIESMSSGKHNMDTDTDWDSGFKKWLWCEE